MKSQKRKIKNKGIKILVFSFSFFVFSFMQHCYAEEAAKTEPVTVNGDKVEYSADSKEVTAVGNVSIVNKDTKLTCESLTVNTETKDAHASGNVRLEEKKGVIEGKDIKYNFQNKTGTINDAIFRSSPFFGRSEKVEKISDAEFIAFRGYMTTCDYDDPHFRFKAKKIDFFPDDKVRVKNIIFSAGTQKQLPLMYLPQFNKSLKDNLMKIQAMPGKSKDWGLFLLTAYRYEISDQLKGKVFLDYRANLGVAEGFDANYSTDNFGKGDFKYYYTQERSRNFEQGSPAEFQRYFQRWRHTWDMDERTNFIAQYYHIVDSKRSLLGGDNNILKDYFPREYEKDTLPPSYAQVHHVFKYSSLDFLMQKRVNRWYPPPQLEKLPEIKYSLPSIKIGDSPFYFDDQTSSGNYNKKNTSTSTPSENDTTPDVHVNRLDTTNKISLPTKVAFVNLTPFASSRQTFYDKDINGNSIAPRTIFYSGADASTKFYRVFNVKSNFLGMDINGLRHIITPGIGYAFNHEPTILNSRLRQIDEVDSLSRNNSAALTLANKLQTKRNGKSVDFVNFLVSTSYLFKPKTGDKRGSNLSDFTYNLDFLPYSWLSVVSDATYKRSGSRSDESYGRVTNANIDFNFNLAPERTIGIGQRYQRKGGNETTFSAVWRISPKWKIATYERVQFSKVRSQNIKSGLREQQYTVTRDLHCWIMDFSYSQERGKGNTLWLIFRLKAFPEMEFELNKDYNAPKPGSQSEY